MALAMDRLRLKARAGSWPETACRGPSPARRGRL
jgi:hypothetical protein